MSFKIGYPDIPWRANAVSGSEDAAFPLFNLFFGSSASQWEADSADTETAITIDMGVGKTATAEYCFIRGIKRLILAQGAASEVEIEVRASTDNFSASNVLIASQTPIVLVGPKQEDCLLTFDLSTAYRYWRIVFKTDDAQTHTARKVYLGRWFNFEDVEPFYPYLTGQAETSSPFVSDRGTLYKSSRGPVQKRWEFNWRTISDYARVAFEAVILTKKDDAPLLLAYDHQERGDDPLSGARVALAWMQDFEMSSGDEWKDNNNVSALFLEDIF